MISEDQYHALLIAVDITYNGEGEKEWIEQEDLARKALGYLKAVIDSPRPTGARWALVHGNRYNTGMLVAIKAITAHDPHHQAIVMPEVDYARMRNRLLRLEEFYASYHPQQELIDDLLAIEATNDIEVLPAREECTLCENGVLEYIVPGSESKTENSFCSCAAGRARQEEHDDALESKGADKAEEQRLGEHP